jgi:hypothetical protein
MVRNRSNARRSANNFLRQDAEIFLKVEQEVDEHAPIGGHDDDQHTSAVLQCLGTHYVRGRAADAHARGIR